MRGSGSARVGRPRTAFSKEMPAIRTSRCTWPEFLRTGRYEDCTPGSTALFGNADLDFLRRNQIHLYEMRALEPRINGGIFAWSSKAKWNAPTWWRLCPCWRLYMIPSRACSILSEKISGVYRSAEYFRAWASIRASCRVFDGPLRMPVNAMRSVNGTAPFFPRTYARLHSGD